MDKILQKLGINSLNDMQNEAIKTIQTNPNTLLLSPTGSGKTLAYLLPLLSILKHEVNGIQVFIIAPTRELVLQIESVMKSFGTAFKINAFYGGHDMDIEIRNLTEPPAILVGTPGRIADHFTRKTINAKSVQTLIFDEFDKTLELGFHDQVAYILEQTPSISKQVFVSATAGISLPNFINISNLQTLDFIKNAANNLNFELKYILSKDRIQSLMVLLGEIEPSATLIFCNQRDEVEEIATKLKAKGINASIFHGKIEQIDREKALIRFRNGSSRYLISTDLAARGLDIPDVENVIHYQLPHHEQEFTHRNGRTARMHASGKAYFFVENESQFHSYIKSDVKQLILPEDAKIPSNVIWSTLYISGGKKDKISKMDIVGFFIQKGNLDKDDLGKIEVKDTSSYAAVKTNKIKSLLQAISDQKMKGKKMKIELAN